LAFYLNIDGICVNTPAAVSPPYSTYDKLGAIDQGAIVENKRLGHQGEVVPHKRLGAMLQMISDQPGEKRNLKGPPRRYPAPARLT
jgi:hypothetical protein